MGTMIKDVIPITLNLQAPQPSGAGFGVPLIIDDVTWTDSRISTYTTLDEAVADGVTTASATYAMLVDMLAQDNTPATIKVGRRLSDANCKQSVTFNADATGGTFKISYGSTADCTAAIEYNTAVATIESALEGLSSITSVTVALNSGSTNPTNKEGFNVEFDGADASTDFSLLTIHVSALTTATSATVTKTQHGSSAEDWDTAYTNIKASNTDWYCVLPSTQDETAIKSLAALVELDQKIMGVQVTASYTDTAAWTFDLEALSYRRTFVVNNKTDGDYKQAALAGRCLPEDLYINWAYRPLRSVTGDTYTSTEIGNIVASKVNRVEELFATVCVPGASSASSGTGGIMVSGDKIDIIRKADQLSIKIQEQLVYTLQQNNNVPFTADGFALIEGVIRSQCKIYGTDIGFLVEDSVVVTMPDLATYDTTKKSNGQLDGIVITGTLSGSVDKISITLNLGF